MVSLRSTLVLRLSVIFTIGENFRKFPKISGNFLLELNFRKIYNPSESILETFHLGKTFRQNYQLHKVTGGV